MVNVSLVVEALTGLGPYKMGLSVGSGISKEWTASLHIPKEEQEGMLTWSEAVYEISGLDPPLFRRQSVKLNHNSEGM